MIRKKVLPKVAPLIEVVPLFFMLISSTVIVNSLSISQSSTKTSSLSSNSQHQRNLQHNFNNNNVIIQQQQQQQQHSYAQQMHLQQQTTLPPPLMTTISQNNYLDSLAQQLQPKQASSSQITDISTSLMNEQRSSSINNNSEEHGDDSVPLETVNNHSRNNQAPARPPQYVDVSALVGNRENRNSSSSSSANSLGLNSGSSSLMQSSSNSGASGLTAKSRSGLPECATQQVCNAIFVRMNYTQKLCECSSNYNWKCSNNLDPQDGHTIELTRKFDKRIYTQIKTCEPLREVRACKSPTDWTLLALQSERSGKAHYVVVCKCPTWAQLEGPYTHNHPPYANIPGIRVYGMLCAHQTARSSAQSYAAFNPTLSTYPEFPWPEALSVLNTTNLFNASNSSRHH